MKREKVRKIAAPIVRAAVTAATKELVSSQTQEVQRKNQFMRKNYELTHANKQLLNHNIALENTLAVLKAKLAQTESDAKESKSRLAIIEGERKRCYQLLQKWETWWERVQGRVGQAFLSKLQWLGRPPPRAADGCWGGGQ